MPELSFIPHMDTPDVPKGTTYCAKFIVAGPVGYKDGVYMLPDEALDTFAWTLKGCPVVIGHQDIVDEADMREKAVGYVARAEKLENGDWVADFVVFDPKAIEKINNGSLPYVSCAYKADTIDEETVINNVKYKKTIVGGTMMHLALVKNPRYNGTDIWKNSEDDYLVSEGVLYNEKGKTMFGIKKTKVEFDADMLINTKDGEKTVEQLVNELEEAKAKIAEQDQQIKDLTAEKEAAEAAKAEAEAAKTEAEAAKAEAEAAATAAKEAAEKSNGDDASLKVDLNNALADNSDKVITVQVPTIDIK